MSASSARRHVENRLFPEPVAARALPSVFRGREIIFLPGNQAKRQKDLLLSGRSPSFHLFRIFLFCSLFWRSSGLSSFPIALVLVYYYSSFPCIIGHSSSSFCSFWAQFFAALSYVSVTDFFSTVILSVSSALSSTRSIPQWLNKPRKLRTPKVGLFCSEFLSK